MSDVAAIILAAGASSRFRAAAGEAGPVTKLIAPLGGMPLVRHAALAALASRARPAIVVTGHARAEVEAALAGLPVAFVHNTDFASGLASSLREGVAALPPDSKGALIMLGDMPRVMAGVLDALIAALDAAPGAQAVVPVFKGARGNPALITRALFPAVAALRGDSGARALLASAGSLVIEAPVDDAAVAFDVDSPEALGGGGAA